MGKICNIQTKLVFPLWEVTLGIWEGFRLKLLHPELLSKVLSHSRTPSVDNNHFYKQVDHSQVENVDGSHTSSFKRIPET